MIKSGMMTSEAEMRLCFRNWASGLRDPRGAARADASVRLLSDTDMTWSSLFPLLGDTLSGGPSERSLAKAASRADGSMSWTCLCKVTPLCVTGDVSVVRTRR